MWKEQLYVLWLFVCVVYLTKEEHVDFCYFLEDINILVENMNAINVNKSFVSH